MIKFYEQNYSSNKSFKTISTNEIGLVIII